MIIPMPIHTNSRLYCDTPVPMWSIIAIIVFLCIFFLAFTPIWVDMTGDFFRMWSNFIYRVKYSYKESIKEWKKQNKEKEK